MQGQIYSATKLQAALSALRARELETTHLFENTGLSPEDMARDDLRVSVHQILQAYKNISQRYWHPNLPFEIGRYMHVSGYGLYGYAVLCSEYVADAAEFAQRYHRLAAPTSEMNFVYDPGEEGWDIEPVVNPLVDRDFYNFLVNLQIGIFTSLHQDLMGQGFVPHLIELTYDAQAPYRLPSDVAREIRYNCSRNRFHLHKDWLERRLELGNRTTFNEITRICETELANLSEQGGVAGEVKKILLQNADLAANMDEVAARMGATSRTLRRRLAREDTSFSALVDEVRADLALRYLRDIRLSVEEIAFVLGFSEAASFVRAFKRWTGKTPNQYRVSPDL